MLAVQEYLRAGNPVGNLTTELGIMVYRHPDLPLVGLKYSMINSPKTNPIVRDCRGLVLEEGTWDCVAKPFRRFFNAGEDVDNFAQFDWTDFSCTTKEDGSLILLYVYQGEWHVNTSGSFGLAECNFSGKTWRELFWETSQIDRSKLNENYTYIFEMWTPYNKVVRTYSQSMTFLLSMFHTQTKGELRIIDVDREAVHLNVPRPEHHQFTCMNDITVFLRHKENVDKTFEGVVIRDRNGERYKIKSDTYNALHHMLDNGNLFNPKRLVPLILAGDMDEVVAYMPEVKPHLETVQAAMDAEFTNLLALWKETRAIESQKEFALAIVKRTRFSSILFQLRKALSSRQDEQALRDYWRQAGDLIIKVLYE